MDTIIVSNEDMVVNSLTSQNGRYTFKQNPDGLVVITDRNKHNKIIWDSASYGNIRRCTTNCTYTLKFQPDGNLVTYSDNNNIDGNKVIWAVSHTNKFDYNVRREGPYTLIMRDDGNLVIYNKFYDILWNVRYDEIIVYNEDIVVKELTSQNGRYTVKQNYDELVVITDRENDNKVIWDSLFSVNNKKNTTPFTDMTTCEPNCTYRLILQPDGNLVTYSDKTNIFGNNYVWAAGNTNKFIYSSRGERPYTLRMQDDGNLVLYNKNSTPYWSTKTYDDNYIKWENIRWGIMEIMNFENLLNALIDSSFYIKWEIIEIMDLIKYANLLNENSIISFTVELNKTNRMFIYEKNSNKLLHITDYIPMSVKCIILIDIKNKDNISSSVNSLNPLPVPNFSVDPNKSIHIGAEGGTFHNIDCPIGSIVSGIYTNEYGGRYLTRFRRSCINPYTKVIDTSLTYGDEGTPYVTNCYNEGGYKKIRGDFVARVDNLSLFTSDDNLSCSAGVRNNMNTRWLDCGANGKVTGFHVRSGNSIHKVSAGCAYPKIK